MLSGTIAVWERPDLRYGRLGLTVGEELTPVMQEAARHRELERLLAISVPRDAAPVAWRCAQRFMFLAVVIDMCHDAELEAYLLLAVANLMRADTSTRQSSGRSQASRNGSHSEASSARPAKALKR